MVENRNSNLGSATADRAAFHPPSAARQAQYAIRHTPATRSPNRYFKNVLEHEPFCVALRLIEVNAWTT
jgi:hypothetical protein